MMARRFLLALAVFACVVLVPTFTMAQGPGSGSTPRPTGTPVQPTVPFGGNGMDTSFARIGTDPRPGYEGRDTPIEARVLLKNSSKVADAHIIMFGFNALSDSVEVRMQDLEDEDGIMVPITQDNRSDSLRQPKVWVTPGDARTDGEIVMRGTVTARMNGQFHVGAIVIAFDKDYNKFVTPQNEYAEVYSFGLLRAAGAVALGEGVPPFEGQGNVPGLGLVAAIVALCSALVLRRRA